MKIMCVSASEKNAVICLTTEDMIEICNALHNAQKIKDIKRSNFYRLYGNLMLVRDLAQHGNLDSFALNSIKECRNTAEKLEDEAWNDEL